MQENKFILTGVVYHKYSRPWSSDKGGKHSEGLFYYLILEHTEQKEGKRKTEEGDKNTYFTKRNLLEFRLGWGITIDDYSIGDTIQVKFSLEGKELKKKDGTPWYKTEMVAYYIKFADIDSGKQKPPVEYSAYKPLKEIFTPPDPDKTTDEGDYDQLPF